RRASCVAQRHCEARGRVAAFRAERVYWPRGPADLTGFAAFADGRAVRDEFALGDAPVVVSVARLAPRRGHDLLLAGFGRLVASLPAARLLLVGKGEMRDQLERLVVEQNLARHV